VPSTTLGYDYLAAPVPSCPSVHKVSPLHRSTKGCPGSLGITREAAIYFAQSKRILAEGIRPCQPMRTRRELMVRDLEKVPIGRRDVPGRATHVERHYVRGRSCPQNGVGLFRPHRGDSIQEAPVMTAVDGDGKDADEGRGACAARWSSMLGTLRRLRRTDGSCPRCGRRGCTRTRGCNCLRATRSAMCVGWKIQSGLANTARSPVLTDTRASGCIWNADTHCCIQEACGCVSAVDSVDDLDGG